MIELTTYQLGVLAIGSVIAGIYILVLSGDWVVDASVALAQRFNLSTVFIGATIIAFGTSVPELFTSVNANNQGYPGISLGNIIGSNIANILMVLGAATMVCTLSVSFNKVKKDILIMLVATTILVLGFYGGVFTRAMGGFMFLLLIGYVVYQYMNNDIDTSEVDDIEMPLSKNITLLLLSFVGLAVGSELLVRGAVVTGSVIGVPEAIIGMTAVAIGTSLPELTASLSAAAKGEIELMFGNIIGSNTFNILSIVAITSMIKPLTVDNAIESYQLWFMVGVSVIFCWMIYQKLKLTKSVGFIFLALYSAFTLFQFNRLFA